MDYSRIDQVVKVLEDLKNYPLDFLSKDFLDNMINLLIDKLEDQKKQTSNDFENMIRSHERVIEKIQKIYKGGSESEY